MVLSHAQSSTTLSQKLQGWRRRQSRRLPAPWHEAALVLLRRALAPARPLLRSLDAPGPRGRPPAAPVCLRRALLWMLLLHSTSRPQWADDRRTHPRLAQIAGCPPFQTPAVGTFSPCIDRLAASPSAPPCAHHLRPSRLRQGRQRRHLQQAQAPRHATQASKASQADPVTERLAQEWLAAAAQPRPHALLTRLDDRLFTGGVLPSVPRGLLGNLQALGLCGEGATWPTGASPHGCPTCDWRAQGLVRCDHERFSPDATAPGGDDAYRAPSLFGHRAFPHWVVTPEHPLPVHVGLAPAHGTDFPMGPISLDRFRKPCEAQALAVTVRAVGYDSGLDALGISQCVQAKLSAPGLALHPRRGAHPAPTGPAAQGNDPGVPLGPASLPLRRHSVGPGGRRLDYTWPVQRPTRRAGRLPWGASREECPRQGLGQPEPQMGPVGYVRTVEAPRLSPPMPRDSAPWKARMGRRTGWERSHAYKTVAARRGERPCRSAPPCLGRLYLLRLLEHACAWLAEDHKERGALPNGQPGLHEAA